MRKKNTDHDRLSKEKHEIAYVKKLAKNYINNLGIFEEDYYVKINPKVFKRICQAVLKLK